MSRTAKRLAVVAGGILLLIGGYIAFRAYVDAVMAGKTVRDGSATVVELRNLGCEEAKQDALDEDDSKWLCSPDERVLRTYLRIDDFPSLSPSDNARLLQMERQNEAKGIWRCKDHHFYFNDVPKWKVGDIERFQFQFFPLLWGSGGSPLIFLGSCKR